jgi:hypothetical protein
MPKPFPAGVPTSGPPLSIHRRRDDAGKAREYGDLPLPLRQFGSRPGQPYGGGDARDKLSGAERLFDIFVGARKKTFNSGRLASAR